MRIAIKPEDVVNYMTSDEKCSRCRKDVSDEVPLRVWKSDDPNYMWIYCERCTEVVLDLDPRPR